MEPSRKQNKISELFTEGFAGLGKVNNSSEATNSASVQGQVRQLIRALEDCTRLVSNVDMFSTNECLEEVSSHNLRYLLLPALLGKLTLKLSTDISGRCEVVKLADAYFKDFLRRCRDYGAIEHEAVMPYLEENEEGVETNENVPLISRDRNADLVTMVHKRSNKIKQFQEEKEREQRLKELQAIANGEFADDELIREYHMTLLKSYIAQSLEEISSLQQEKNILQHMEQLNKESAEYDSEILEAQRPPSRRPPPSKKGLMPVIITKDQAMKQVFGAGYPSLPVMTVDEFYEQRVQQGIFPVGQASGCGLGPCSHSHEHGQAAGVDIDPEIVKEYHDERDDPATLARNRAMDDYKDDHRRGEGNTYNRS
ncbi:immunoglobulin-binding protein 1b [Neocloeon triangulifer]|uniref:immunoglobulin-binding protein 1b n=1 Tax=Neocloeon triangulifer TaxID=2078957 RepID=UPI00286F1855|nr:immunoglobulin-binding protein 1b [Neocloeon triangulifer]XP_059483862.1 immunoglobulin-binding protein 1b [Neocloeon triangulifer]XP_059483863.1 immunoglobulin-binding protein 1b [Neocloeon triangulifer]